jgi:hypothetical protein
MVPLRFFFSRRLSCALPLVALSCQKVTIRIKLRPWDAVIRHTNPAIQPPDPPALREVSLLTEFVYLEKEERLRFSESRHVLLIDVPEMLTFFDVRQRGHLELSGLHGAVKELIVVFQRPGGTSTTFLLPSGTTFPDYNDFGNYTSDPDPNKGRNMISSLALQLNGASYFEPNRPQYYNIYLPYRLHTGIPTTGVYLFPFCLRPEDLDPSGTLTIDQIDQARIVYEGSEVLQGGSARVYSLRYNLLDIADGQGRLLFG